MNLAALPRLYRSFGRSREILTILSKYGLADWFSYLKIEAFNNHLKSPDGEILTQYNRAARIRLALTELGPTFIKLGQILSTRPDLVGNELSEELKSLQTAVPADPTPLVITHLEATFKKPLAEVFQSFDETPIASASIGQAHRAILHDGSPVIVKVKHAGIDENIRRDMGILEDLAEQLQKIPEMHPYRPVDTVHEFQRTLLRELDFSRERSHIEQFAKDFATDTHVHIPKVYRDYCSSSVLTMEYLEGIDLRSVARLQEAGYDLDQVTRQGTRIFLEMIFLNGFFHADPHPGNILVMKDNVIGLIDFGMVGRLDEQMREALEDLLFGISRKDSALLVSVIMQLGTPPFNLDTSLLERDLTEFVAFYGNQTVAEMNIGMAINEIIELVRKFQISLHPQVALVLKTLVMLDGSGRAMAPSFSMMEALQPLHTEILMHRMSPLRKLKKMRLLYRNLERIAELLPQRTMELLDQMKAGKFDIHLEHRGLEPSVNRLVLGLLTSALFLGSSLMMAFNVPPLLFPEQTVLGLHRVSFFGIAGSLVSFMLGFRILRAIKKSGHLD